MPPPGIACGVSACAPLPHAIETVLPFHSSSHPASFPSRVSPVMSIKCIHTEIPARNSSTTTFTKLRDRILATKIVYVHNTVVRASSLAVLATCTGRNVHAPLYINSHQTSVVMRLMIGFCVEFLSETHTSNELRSHAGFDTLSDVFRFRAYSPYSGSFAGFTQLTAQSTQR